MQSNAYWLNWLSGSQADPRRLAAAISAAERARSVTAADVQKAAATYIQPGKFDVVIAGDRKAIEAGVRSLNLGQVRIVSVQEAIGS
jgi:predicted Zn-dependent peptidase